MSEPTDQEVLAAIEEIVADDFCFDIDMIVAFHPEQLTDRERTMAKKISHVYRLAHGFNRANSCYCVHTDWRALIPQPEVPPSTPEATDDAR